MLVLAGMFVKVMEKANCAVAPGSPVIAAPLFTDTPLAVYDEGSVSPMLSVPVSAKVSLLLFEVPDIVSVPPFFPTEAVSSMVANSAFADCMIVSVLLSTPEALNVADVCRATRPVCTAPSHDTVSLPLPLTLLGVTHAE